MTVAAVAVREKLLQNWVIDAFKKCGWAHTYHTWISIRSDAGFPDVLAIDDRRTPARIVAVELKGRDAKGRTPAPTPAQRGWLDALAAAGVECYVFGPDDWDSGLIERVICGDAR